MKIGHLPSSHNNIHKKSIQKSLPLSHHIYYLTLLLLYFVPEIALASDPFKSVLDEVTNLLNGATMRAIASIAVIGLGISALSGHLAMKWAISIVIGIVLIFGASAIVDLFADSAL